MTVGSRRRNTIPTLLIVLLGIVPVLGSCTSTAPAAGLALGSEYYNLGNTWFDLKKFDLAAKAYQNALAWNPDLKVANLNLARCKAELGDPAGALVLLEPLASSDPDNLIVAQYRAWLTAKQNGPASAAGLYLDLALRLPGDAASQLNAGLCLKAADRTADALERLKIWKGLDGKGAAGLGALAEILEKNGDDGAADAWMDVAASMAEGDVKRFAPLVSRARVLEKGQLYGDAVKALNAALALTPAPDQPRGETLFRKGSLLLLEIEDYAAGSKALLDAWKAGYKDSKAWAALRNNKDLKFTAQLEADLKLAGVNP